MMKHLPCVQKASPLAGECPESVPPDWQGVRRVSPLAGGVSGEYPPGVRKVSPRCPESIPPGWGTAPPRVGDHTPWHGVLKNERFVSTKRYFLKQMMKHPPGVRKVSPLAGGVSGEYPPRVGDHTPQGGGPHPPGWETTPLAWRFE